MNLDFTLNLHDLETLLTKSNCSCHFINPHKTRILMWKEKRPDSELSSKEVKDGVTTYHLRIGIQKFSSQEQLDRNGEIYWRFMGYDYSEVKTAATKVTASETKQELDPITKFNQRQAQAEEFTHERNPESNNSQSS